MANSTLMSSYPEIAFGGFSEMDSMVSFYIRVNALVGPSTVLADIGCGRGAYGEDPLPFRRNLRVFRGRVARVIGLDVDPEASENPHIDEFRLLTGSAFPLDDASVDVILADAVIEHVEDPQTFFRECARVLRPGGYLCLRTTNLLSYVGMAARLIPNRLHARILSRVQNRREERDVFPTLYRCNTIGKLRRALERSGFEAVVYGVHGEPSYLAFSKPVFKLGVALHRLAPRSFGASLMGFARRR